MKIRQMIFLFLILTLFVVACAPAAEAPAVEAPTAVESTTEPAGEEPADEEPEGYQPPEDGPAARGELSVNTANACAIVSEEQVAAAFGKDVVEVNANTQTIGAGCEYVFDADSETELQVSVYSGDTAKHYLAGLVQASRESCDAFFEKLFDVAFGEEPDSGQDVSGLSMANLYRDYLGIFENCPAFVQVTDRTDIGSNVLTAELMVFNWSSTVALLGNDQVVEFTYQEPISAEAQADFQGANDRDSFYAAAQPYADTVLASYTEILIGLVQGAASE